MTTTISGTSGVTFPAGGVGNPAGAVVGTTDTQTQTNKTLTSPAIGGTPVMSASVLTSGTAVTCAGQTSIDFTGIPSWVKRITVMFNNVSTSGTSNYSVQIGTSGGIENTGYNSFSARIGNASLAAGNSQTTGFAVNNPASAAESVSGQMTISLLGSNIWTESGFFSSSGGNGLPTGGGKTLSGTLDRVRITTVNGTDTFDTIPSAGSINILYE